MQKTIFTYDLSQLANIDVEGVDTNEIGWFVADQYPDADYKEAIDNGRKDEYRKENDNDYCACIDDRAYEAGTQYKFIVTEYESFGMGGDDEIQHVLYLKLPSREVAEELAAITDMEVDLPPKTVAIFVEGNGNIDLESLASILYKNESNLVKVTGDEKWEEDSPARIRFEFKDITREDADQMVNTLNEKLTSDTVNWFLEDEA